MIRSSSLALAVAFLAACGGTKTPDLPQNPQIAADRNALTFGGPVLATCTSTQTAETPLFFNKGQNDLIITAATVSGSNASLFTVATDTLPVTVTSNNSTWVRVTYSPTAAGTHTGTLTITSNAENTPALQLSLSATACACTSSGQCK